MLSQVYQGIVSFLMISVIRSFRFIFISKRIMFHVTRTSRIVTSVVKHHFFSLSLYLSLFIYLFHGKPTWKVLISVQVKDIKINEGVCGNISRL